MDIVLSIIFVCILVVLNIVFVKLLRDHMLYAITIVDIILYILGFTFIFIGYLIFLIMLISIITGIL